MKILKKYIFLSLIFTILGCNTVSKKVDETTANENLKLSKFLKKNINEVKIQLGKPDIVEKIGNNTFYTFKKSKLKINCERKFEVNQKNIVIGFTSKNCF